MSPSFLPSLWHSSGTCGFCAFISQALTRARAEMLQLGPWTPWTTRLPPGSSLEALVLTVVPALGLGIPVGYEASSGWDSGVFCGFVVLCCCPHSSSSTIALCYRRSPNIPWMAAPLTPKCWLQTPSNVRLLASSFSQFTTCCKTRGPHRRKDRVWGKGFNVSMSQTKPWEGTALPCEPGRVTAAVFCALQSCKSSRNRVYSFSHS